MFMASNKHAKLWKSSNPDTQRRGLAAIRITGHVTCPAYKVPFIRYSYHGVSIIEGKWGNISRKDSGNIATM